MRLLTLFLSLLISISTNGQTMAGTELLNKSIAYHDPESKWTSFQGKIKVTMSTPNDEDRISKIVINLPEEFFELITIKEEIETNQSVKKDSCHYTLNGSSKITNEQKEKHRLTCKRSKMIKNYYTYLYGLPMKLKDPGTIIHPDIEERQFNNKLYKVLKVTYDENVGKDTWYFYFDPETYAMEVYQFFKVESKNDGEYILLSGEEIISGIKMPKVREWYYNKDNKYLGTDVLTKY